MKEKEGKTEADENAKRLKTQAEEEASRIRKEAEAAAGELSAAAKNKMELASSYESQVKKEAANLTVEME